jgi:hypothetical protein
MRTHDWKEEFRRLVGSLSADVRRRISYSPALGVRADAHAGTLTQVTDDGYSGLCVRLPRPYNRADATACDAEAERLGHNAFNRGEWKPTA